MTNFENDAGRVLLDTASAIIQIQDLLAQLVGKVANDAQTTASLDELQRRVSKMLDSLEAAFK